MEPPAANAFAMDAAVASESPAHKRASLFKLVSVSSGPAQKMGRRRQQPENPSLHWPSLRQSQERTPMSIQGRAMLKVHRLCRYEVGCLLLAADAKACAAAFVFWLLA